MSQAGAAAPPAPRREVLDWVFALIALAYAYLVHQGIGPSGFSDHPPWYQPRGFFFGWSWLAFALETAPRVMFFLTLPAVALACATFLAGRSAVARGLALSAVVAVLLFTFYGFVALRVWEFFHWRGSAVLALTSLAVGFAWAAPFLARSWLRYGWWLRLALFVPVVFLVLALVCNATGTDERLRFAISPWPAVAVFGIEVGALFATITWLGTALGVTGLARARGGGGAAAAVLGVLLGALLPLLLLAAGSAAGLLPFRAGAETLAAAAGACLLAVAAAGLRGDAAALGRRARHLAVGAALIALPLFGAELWARWDYQRTREVRARQLIDGLEAYLAREEIYPDELEELVAAGDLAEIPTPAIGFPFLYDHPFRYRSFGTSFILEFPALRWVECAYTPPYQEEETGSSAGGEGVLSEAWSCPSRPPELW